MTYKAVRLLRNNKTGQTFQQKYTKKTIFHRFTEDDYIEIGILLYYCFNIEINPDAMNINVVDKGAIDIFTTKAQTYITANGNIIKLSDFDGTKPEISNYNYTEYIDKWKMTDFKKMGNYRKNTGYLNDNLLYLNYIKHNVINLSELFDELSDKFEATENDILYKNLKAFQNWRNRIINDTVNNFDYVDINKNFLSFILLHLFILCNRKFNIRDLEYIDGGKITINRLENMINLKIKQIKNKIKKSKSLRKKSKRKSRRN
jgi:hypothetical protein